MIYIMWEKILETLELHIILLQFNMSCKLPQLKIQYYQPGNVKLDIVGFFRIRIKFHASCCWESALLRIPSGSTDGLWCERLNSNTGKGGREICSVAYGKFKICQVVKDDIPIFLLKLLEVHTMEIDEQKNILFIR